MTLRKPARRWPLMPRSCTPAWMKFVTWALRFVDAGLDEDEPVLVSAPGPEISFLRARMNGRAQRVSWADI